MRKLLYGILAMLLIGSFAALKKEKLNVIDLENKIISFEKVNHELTDSLNDKHIKEITQLAEEIYGVEAEFLEAIERLETGNYTSTLYKAQNNTWGAKGEQGYKYFDSHEQSTLELARCLKMYYFDEGLVTITQIGEKYCPEDPYWSYKVHDIYLELMK